MKSDNDSDYEELTEEIKDSSIRSKIFVVSSHEDQIKLHTNIFSLKNCDIKDLIDNDEDAFELQMSHIVIDTKQSTQGLNIEEVKMLWLQSLNPRIDPSLVSFNESESVCNSIQKEEEIKYKYEDEWCGLNNRNKFQKLSKDQIWFLKSILMTNALTIKQIQSKYWVSYSTLNKIRRCSMSKLNKSSLRGITKIHGTEKKILIKTIGKLLFGSKATLNAKEVTNNINKELSTSYSANFVRNVMKNDMKLTFKKVKWRPISIDLDRIYFIRWFFSIIFSKVVSDKVLLINIDESSINRSVKTSYSWGRKGQIIEAQNSTITGSASMVLAICSNGAWISLVINETISSDNFTWFIKIMVNWLKSHSYFGYSQVMILLDNWSIHRSKVTKTLFEKINFITWYIPVYSPDFAPVEMWFSLIKRALWNVCKKDNYKITISQNYTKIYDSLLQLKSVTVKKMFAHFYRIINQHLQI